MNVSGPTRLILLLAGAWMAVAPWPMEQRPHLYGKLEWLWVNGGEHMRPIDIFDLFFHGTWAVVAVWALLTSLRRERAPAATEPPG